VKLPNKSTVLPSMTGEAVTYKGANGIGAGAGLASAAKDGTPRVSAARRKERERGDFME
jgi:hypothetical protein